MVVCIPSYKEADAISFPTSQADEGLRKYFREYESVIINCDNNSPDHTREAFLETRTTTPKMYLSTEPGLKGKGNNFRNLFQKVVDLKAKAVVVVDADLKSITPEWIKHLGEPLFSGFSYVAPPIYSSQIRRHHHQRHRLPDDKVTLRKTCPPTHWR